MSARSSRRWVTSVAIAVAIGCAPVTTAHAGPAVRAIPQWSMAPLVHDVNDDGVIDGDGGVPARGALSTQPSARRVGAGNHRAQPNERLIDGRLSWYLPGKDVAVQLNACRSSGAEYRWRIASSAGRTDTTWRAMGKCRTTVRLPQGDAKLTLEVRDGAQHASSTTTAAVRTLLVVAMGDSYASGEGNPRNVQAWLRQGGSLDPYWDDNACHRSARGGPAAAALALEKADPHTSVSLVYVACSGATIANGILGPQAGVGASVGQVEQVRQVIGDRPVDYVFLSIGGNDVGFTSVLETCARTNDCPLARPAGSLSSFPTLQRGVQTTTAQLPQGYAHIAACLGGSGCTRTDGTSQPALTLAPGASVLPVLYPDITRDAAGAPCTYLTIGSNEFAWARDTILDPSPPNPYAFTTSSGAVVPLATDAGSLNGQLSATGSALGWRPAAGAWLASGTGATGHGVCAGEQAWAFGFTGLSALPSASFHPNPAGQRAIADALVAAARG